MAKVNNMGIFEDVSGQIGHVVVSKTKKKKYIKQKGKKNNNHTEAKTRTESLFSDLPTIWRMMKRWEKKTWEKLVKGSHSFKSAEGKVIVDGMNLFVSVNRNLQELGEPLLRIAPNVDISPDNVDDIKVKIIIGDKDWDILLYKDKPIETDRKVIIYATSVLTTGKDDINPRQYRLIRVIDSNFVSGSSIKENYQRVFKKVPEERDEISVKHKIVIKATGISSLVRSQFVEAIRQTDQPAQSIQNQ